jgi:hypothetical protein
MLKLQLKALSELLPKNGQQSLPPSVPARADVRQAWFAEGLLFTFFRKKVQENIMVKQTSYDIKRFTA